MTRLLEAGPDDVGYGWRRELLLEEEDENRGISMSYNPSRGRAAEAARQAQIDREVAAAKARATAPPAVKIMEAANGHAPPELKGAVKVDAWPERCKYPFRQIADDGGIWRVDPAAYDAKASSVRAAASKWAIERGLKATTVLDSGLIYVQFTKATS